MDISLLDRIIIGRVEPHIYAFETNTIPNYLKVGDTYRPVSVRLDEWRRYYRNLEKKYDDVAKVNQNVYYRDFAIHSYLENEKKRKRLQPEDLAPDLYYSQEFFENATTSDIEEAVEDIRKDYEGRGGRYKFYNAEDNLPEIPHYDRTETYGLRPNQTEVVNNFINAIESGHTNLLMYAVMRFGKSFTSMYCALKMDAKIVVIVSAKADVKEEWKKTIQSHTLFEDFVFLDKESLERNHNIVTESRRVNKKVALFLTLQELNGEEIRERHRDLFANVANNLLDLLIVDETHFGARAEKYGSVLRDQGQREIRATKNKRDNDDFIETSEADNQIKELRAKVKLHLSGTPYRILIGGEFSKDDIIAFYQSSDIVRDKKKWNEENIDNILEDKVNEWDNPYFGFPKMIRFAFNLNQSSISKLEQLKKTGEACDFSVLFKTQSLIKDSDEKYKKFLHEKEILDFLEVIDGSKEDDNFLGFLDYEGIKKGNMCHHIVMVLPYCASCDAMETLILLNSEKFKNLKDYEVINISGLTVSAKLGTPLKVRNCIARCEKEGKKTLTLTVNRMLTGSTVPEWDTMLYLKDTSSPQEYDQAVFRLQNQFIKSFVDNDGNIIKYNMKPQTLLVDFMPGRLFRLQEQRAQIYNAYANETGNERLEERIKDELEVSPVIILNKDKIVQVEAADIISAVSEYSKSRGVAEETGEIPVDLSLMEYDVIRRAIERENEIGSKNGFTIKSVAGEGINLDIPPAEGNGDDKNLNNPSGENTGREANKDPVKQFRSYYARILFFSFLTKDRVKSLSDIIEIIEKPNNKRIAKNVGVSRKVLAKIKEKISIFVLRDLDYKIYNLNKLSKDPSIEPLERARIAVQKFGKLGESEVITPSEICEKMIATVPDAAFVEAIRNKHKILNIAGKAGEFELAVYERYLKLGYSGKDIKDIIYSIPTSGLTYEFSRMVYEILGLNIKNIAEKIDCYSLLNIKNRQDYDYGKMAALISQDKNFNIITINDIVSEEDRRVKFDIVVGNPPYQLGDGGNGASSTSIYPIYVNVAKEIRPKYITMIIEARWYSGGKGLDEFRTQMTSDTSIRVIYDYPNASECFPGVEIKGGICYFLWNRDEKGLCKVYNHNGSGEVSVVNRPLLERNADTFIRYNKAISIFQKVVDNEQFSTFKYLVSPRKTFGFSTNFAGKRQSPDVIKVYQNGGIGYIKRGDIPKGLDLVDKWKIYISKAYGAGEIYPHQILGKPIIGAPGSCCTETYLVIGPFDSESIASNIASYIKTKFFRFMVLLKKITQDATNKVYGFVPMQDFSKPWTDAELYENYHLKKDEIAYIESMVKPMGETRDE